MCRTGKWYKLERTNDDECAWFKMPADAEARQKEKGKFVVQS